MSFNFRNQSNEGISSNHSMPSNPENHRNSDSEMAALSDLEDDNEDDDDDIDADDQEGDEDLPYPGFIPFAMKYLDQKTRPRNWCLAMITNPWFERVSMLVILLNCVTLGMYQPCEEGNCGTTRCKILQVFDDFIFAFFTIEMTVKIIAMGMYGKGTYLADSWNRLDFFIVLAGALEYCLNVENKNLSAIRTIRVLRPLRAINRIPSMRILVMLLLDTLPMLGNVLLLCFFVFFIFGIVGVQLWEGILRQRCYLKQLPNISYPEEIQNRSFYSIRSHVTSYIHREALTGCPKKITIIPNGAIYFRFKTTSEQTKRSLSLHYIEQEKDYICSRPDDNGMHTCNNLPHYKIGDMICNDSAVPNSLNTPTNTSCVNWNQYYTECKSQGSNPFQGTISFDNIGLAWVAIFLVISLEGWTDIMYYVQDAHSFWDWIYFVLLIVIGSFFMINLCLVVIATQFSETKKREMERMRLERARFHSTSTLASSTNNSEPTTCYAEIVKYIAHLWRRAKRRILKKYRLYRYKRQHEQERKLIIRQNLSEPIGIPPSRFIMQFHGGHDESGPPLHQNLNFPRYHHHHHHRHYHHHHHLQNDYHSCSHTCRLTCKCHNPRHRPSSQGPLSGLSSTVSRPTEGNSELADTSAPHASPEISDIDLQSSPRRLVLGKANSGSSLRVPSINNIWNENINEGSRSGSSLLSPSSINEQRRRSSVMFSDEVTTLNSGSEAKNVCSSEKMTQTGDGEVWQPKTNEIQAPASSELTIPDLSNETMTCQELLAFSGAISAALPTGQLAIESLFNSLTKGVQEKNLSGKRWLEGDICSCCGEPPPGACPICPSADWSIVMDVQKESVAGKHIGRNRLKEFGIECRNCITCSLCNIQRLIKALVEHKYFQQGILLAILFNTLSMGIEYHNQPEELTVIVEISNIVFSGIFAVEMLLKVIAEGPFGYISNGFNVFDGVIVILSIVELCQTFLDGSGNDRAGSSGLSVLRTFRLLRILKLVRFMPNLRRQLFVMLRTMDNVAVFFSLLILFIFIFSILGMNLFGCKFYDVTDDGHKHYDRKNFDSLLWALVTVFQAIMSQYFSFRIFSQLVFALFYLVRMYLFGGKFCMLSDGSRECTCIEISLKDPDCVCDRKHFNNFLWATVTVFQILTQEDWNVVLFNGMEKTSHWAALYFVALMTFGNYVLFNLLVAILVEGFSSERNERREREARELEKQREKAAEIAAALFEEAIRASPTSDSSESSLHPDKKNKWRSAEDIHQTKLKKTKVNDLKTKENVWKPNQNYEKDQLKCINVQKESKLLSETPLDAPSLPLITHTAATPQDSPNTTADTNTRELNNKMSFNTPFDSSAPSIDSIDKFNSSQWSIPGLLKPPDNYKLTKNNLSNSSHNGLSKDAIKATTSKDHRPTCPPRRVRSWRLSRSSLKKKSRRNSGTLEELDDNQDQEIILNNNHLNHRSGSDHSRCNGNLLFSNTIRNDTQSHKCFNSQNLVTCKHSSRDVPQIGWSDSILIQGCSKKENFEYPVTINGLKANEKGVEHKETLQSKATASVSDNDICLTKVKQKEEFILNPENVESLDNLDINTNPLAEVIPKVFYCFKKTGCFKEREDYSLYFFPIDNKFRQSCIWIVERKWFDNMVLLFIGLNCITLAMERPNIPPNSTERLFLQCANYIFTVVFALEMLVKVIATGMFYGENAYFTSGWNIMDGTLVTISIVDLLMSMISESSPRIFGILRVFRLLRSLRPLRVINRAPGLKLVVQTLLSSLRPIGNIVLICCTFFIIFGILGVQLFKGTFYYCEGPNIENVKNKTDCLADTKNQWINRKYNFDDLGKALMSLFVLSSRDGWVNIMYTGLDAVGVDLQPIKNYSEWRLLYFIAFILLVGFFVLNMFVGVVVENFHRCREEQEKEERMIRLAKRAKQMEKKRRKMHEPPYYTNYSKPRLVIHNVVTSKYFDLAIAAVIGLNVVTMAMEFYMMPRPLTYALKIFNYFFTAVFILELFMKLLALGIKLYLKDKWNQLDVAIVFLSIVGIVLEELESKIIPINPTIIRVMRVLRIARVLKLLKMAKGIRALLDTVMQALPQVGNLGLLFFLLFFIFAALGVELFGRLECSDEMPCQGLGEHAHFANFGMAFLTLFRVATGDNWNGIMKDTLRDNCDDNADCVKNCCVSTVIAPIFFVIFVLMAQFVLVNVVVAVLMKHLEESHKQMEDEIDMEVELERELQQEQEELEEELCLKALEEETQIENRLKRPLGKVLSLPANFIYHTGITSKDSLNSQADDPKTRRGSSISFQSTSQASRRQTFHSQRLLLPPFNPTSGFGALFTMDQDKKGYDQNRAENIIDRQKLLRRMSNAEQKRKSSLSPGNSRRGSLFKPRTELQTLLGLSKSAGLMPCPSPQQLLSLTELVVDEKEREKRILRKALSMENRTASEDVSPESISPGLFLLSPSYSPDKTHFKTPEDVTLRKPEKRPFFRQQKTTEGMEKIEEGSAAQKIFAKKLLQERRRTIFKQSSLDSKHLPFDKTREICPDEIAMVVQERRTPYIRELRNKTRDFSLDETPFVAPPEVKDFKLPFRRQLTSPALEEHPPKDRKSDLFRQEKQEKSSTENLINKDSEDYIQLSMLENRNIFFRKSTQGSSDGVETVETSLTTHEAKPSFLTEKKNDADIKEKNSFYGRQEKCTELSLETTASTGSNSTTLTNLQSDSLISEGGEKDKFETKEEVQNLKESTTEISQYRKNAKKEISPVLTSNDSDHDISEISSPEKDENY